jgi:hypothetical protein
MREASEPPIDEARVKGFGSQRDANAWLLANPETAVAGVHFTVSDPASIDFQLQVNTTLKSFRGTTQDPIDLVALPLQVSAQREIVRCAPLH